MTTAHEVAVKKAGARDCFDAGRLWRMAAVTPRKRKHWKRYCRRLERRYGRMLARRGE